MMLSESFRAHALLLFGFVTTSLAFSPTVLHASSPRTTSLSAMKDDESVPAQPALDRRTFFQSAATKAVVASSVLATASMLPLVSSVDVANAADSSVFTSLYKPAPHSMDGKTVVVTGGNVGLGLESSKRLAEAGATVVFTTRDDTKGTKALDEIKAYLGASGVDSAGKAMMINLDLCDLDNVKSFKGRLENIIGKDTKIDVLMNNAGVMAIPDRRLTKDGFEKTFQTNHLGHFALTSTVLPLLSPNARIINVSSTGYQFAGKGLDLDNLNGEKNYGPWSSYGESKLENILFTNELHKRAQQSENWSSLQVFSLHPGVVQTDLARYLIGEEKFNNMKEKGFQSWTDKVVMESLAKFAKTVEEGASTQVFLAAYGNIDKSMLGKYFVDGKVTALKPFALDEVKAKELWSTSEKLSGVKFEL
eukprot:scaffold1163_cov193-Alexandrium_tamarense.AAC.14